MVIADTHLDPGELFPFKPDGFTILLGDIINILPHGMGAWRTAKGMQTVTSVMDSVDGVWLLGNHEGRLSWLRELVDGRMTVHRFLEIDGTRFEHGHRFAPDWAFLSRFAPSVVEWLVSNPLTRRCWYDFCKKQGWIAYGNESSSKFETMAGVTLGRAQKWADEHGPLVMGHLHIDLHTDNLTVIPGNEVV